MHFVVVVVVVIVVVVVSDDEMEGKTKKKEKKKDHIFVRCKKVLIDGCIADYTVCFVRTDVLMPPT